MTSWLLMVSALFAQDAKAPKTPEAAFRTFMVAVFERDEPTLRAVTLPAEGFEWLLQGQVIPKDQVAAMRAQLEKMPIKVLKAGDTIKLPGNRTATVGAEEVGEDRAVLLPQGAPVPTRCRKVEGVWRVDAAPIIAGRKAADSARKAAQEKAKAKAKSKS